MTQFRCTCAEHITIDTILLTLQQISALSVEQSTIALPLFTSDSVTDNIAGINKSSQEPLHVDGGWSSKVEQVLLSKKLTKDMRDKTCRWCL